MIRRTRSWIARRSALDVGTAVGMFVALALALAAGGPASAIVAMVLVGTAFAATRILSAPADRAVLERAVLLIFAARLAFTAVLHLWLLSASGAGGAMFGDDQGYTFHATRLARWWLGEPVADPTDPMDAVPGVSYIQFAAFLFTLAGTEPFALKVMNTGLAVLSGFLFYRAGASALLPNARWIAYLMWIYPSLVLWSALTLKESFVIFLMAIAVWSVAEQIKTRRFIWWVPFVISLLVLYSSRSWLFVMLVLAWPAALLVAGRSLPRAVGATAVAFVLLAGTPATTYFTPEILAAPGRIRAAMAQGARSAFVTPTPGPTVASAGGGIVYVEVTEPPATLEPSGSSGGAPSASPPPRTPRPPPTPRPIAYGPIGPIAPARTEPRVIVQTEQLTASIQHLPIGALYVVAAPVPWNARGWLELATIPEMLLWYATIGFALRALLRRPLRSWRPHAYALLMMLGIALALSLVEGNVGTLVRHRGMLIPFVATLAAVGLEGTRLATLTRWPTRGPAAH